MKYIRTKDGILDLDKIFPSVYITIDGEVIKVNKKGQLLIDYDKMFDCKTKLADTIEELCDEFVSVYKNLTPELLEPKFISPREPLSVSWKNRLEEERLFKDNAVYGAIWTDKGLIYVARMNDKGELELL